MENSCEMFESLNPLFFLFYAWFQRSRNTEGAFFTNARPLFLTDALFIRRNENKITFLPMNAQFNFKNGLLDTLK